MAFHPEALQPIAVLVAVAIAVVIFYYLIRWIRHTLGHLGLSPGEIAVIIWATLIGSLITPIPLAPLNGGYLGINVGGAVVPIVLSAYLIRRKGLPVNEVLVGILLVAAVSYLVTTYDPEMGAVYATFPWWLLPPFTAFLVAAFAYWHERPHSAALAYVSGTLGTLIGADIVRLPEIIANPPDMQPVNGAVPILAIGGAGIFDMVFLAGILAVTMEAGLLARTREDLVSQRRHNPIEAELEEWVRQKEREAEENRRKYREIEATRKEDPRAYAQRQLREQLGHHRRDKGPSPREAEADRGGAAPGQTAATRTGGRYQPRYTQRYRERARTYKPRYRSATRRRPTTTARTTSARDRPSAARQAQERRAQTARQRAQRRDPPRRPEDKKEREGERERERWSAVDEPAGGPPPVEGPRPPPRQPRPASGTKRVPTSHRARGLYRS